MNLAAAARKGAREGTYCPYSEIDGRCVRILRSRTPGMRSPEARPGEERYTGPQRAYACEVGEEDHTLRIESRWQRKLTLIAQETATAPRFPVWRGSGASWPFPLACDTDNVTTDTREMEETGFFRINRQVVRHPNRRHSGLSCRIPNKDAPQRARGLYCQGVDALDVENPARIECVVRQTAATRLLLSPAGDQSERRPAHLRPLGRRDRVGLLRKVG